MAKLDWINHSKNLTEMIQMQLMEGIHTDFTLICDDGRVQCHKFLLAACSPLLSKLILHNPESRSIIFFGERLQTVKNLLHLLYTGTVPVDAMEYNDLASLGKSAQITCLRLSTPNSSLPPFNPDFFYPEVILNVPQQKQKTPSRLTEAANAIPRLMSAVARVSAAATQMLPQDSILRQTLTRPMSSSSNYSNMTTEENTMDKDYSSDAELKIDESPQHTPSPGSYQASSSRETSDSNPSAEEAQLLLSLSNNVVLGERNETASNPPGSIGKVKTKRTTKRHSDEFMLAAVQAVVHGGRPPVEVIREGKIARRTFFRKLKLYRDALAIGSIENAADIFRQNRHAVKQEPTEHEEDERIPDIGSPVLVADTETRVPAASNNSVLKQNQPARSD